MQDCLLRRAVRQLKGLCVAAHSPLHVSTFEQTIALLPQDEGVLHPGVKHGETRVHTDPWHSGSFIKVFVFLK